VKVRCSECDGDGEIKKTCEDCDGEGKVSVLN
jgi:DnaJ-class molecular chaperone